MRSKSVLRAVFALAAMSLCAAALPNDGWWVGVGNAKGFGNHKYIRMASEDLRFRFQDRWVDVEVDFRFVNDGPATTVTMGFPENRNNYELPAITRFETWVDGRKASARRKALRADYDGRDYSAVWLKDVKFAKGQSRRVRVRYRAPWSGDTSGNSSFSYILSTGATWKGPIERLRITADWSAVRKHSRPYLCVREGAIAAFREAKLSYPRPRVESFELTNLKPDFDLDFNAVEGFWSFTVNGKRVGYAQAMGGRVSGRRSDPIVPVAKLNLILGRNVVPSRAAFNGLVDDEERTLLTAARSFKPRRGAFIRPSNALPIDRIPHVYLRDIVAKLGGRLRYDPVADRIDIWLPPAKRAAK